MLSKNGHNTNNRNRGVNNHGLLVLPQALTQLDGAVCFYSGIHCTIYHKTLKHDLFDIEFYSNQVCLVYVVSGKETLISKHAKQVTLCSGDAIVLAPGETLHSDYFSASGELTAWLVFFSPSMLVDLPHHEHTSNVYHANASFSSVSDTSLLSTFFMSLTAYQQKSLLCDQLFTAKTNELLCILKTLSTPSLSTLLNANNHLLGARDNFKRLIEKCDFLTLSVTDMAQLCNMSHASFLRQFKSAYDMTPTQWLTHKRLSHAQSLLIHTDLTVTDIAATTGYLDTSHFIKMFKRKFGVTPNRYKYS
ncbi:helix-turn-helix transcriptional regulator [Pseudoalteromonas sp. MMG013]|uniref:helix-turn-helix domain-containing protein n=1 Tax=Pseudoalteromonas sp. MMG013 TaxID=2822687 RepID=UPI001B37CB3B|nr:helix-turn-helix transcriptional regulator [Pseudoalteromonas sp. MMG013]MBQ4860761.1 helix-turn-helix transcriptional regulator [Pseudoalteromonas sp. MMG013]